MAKLRSYVVISLLNYRNSAGLLLPYFIKQYVSTSSIDDGVQA